MSELTMPKSGHLMEEGTVVAWKKKVGEPVAEGEVIAEIETDKGVLELESPFGGIVKNIVVQEQKTVPIGTVLAIIE
jgi:pyruvate dehydrogenase E2 component (dihydrolipoamide acetyltransferase)